MSSFRKLMTKGRLAGLHGPSLSRDVSARLRGLVFDGASSELFPEMWISR